MIRQLPLGIQLRASASFRTFVTTPANEQALSAVRQCAEGRGEPFVYLWGECGTGKSHLLQAACQAVNTAGSSVVYIPLQQRAAFSPEILSDLQTAGLVCLDDLQSIAGDTAWEQALFHLFNRLRDTCSHLLTSASCAPASLSIELPDLSSRLGWGLCYHLHTLDDTGREQMLMAGAETRGMQLPVESARYILHRAPRDMASLQALLEELDRASLAAQRPLTIPFVRSVLFGDG